MIYDISTFKFRLIGCSNLWYWQITTSERIFFLGLKRRRSRESVYFIKRRGPYFESIKPGHLYAIEVVNCRKRRPARLNTELRVCVVTCLACVHRISLCFGRRWYPIEGTRLRGKREKVVPLTPTPISDSRMSRRQSRAYVRIFRSWFSLLSEGKSATVDTRYER